MSPPTTFELAALAMIARAELNLTHPNAVKLALDQAVEMWITAGIRIGQLDPPSHTDVHCPACGLIMTRTASNSWFCSACNQVWYLMRA